LYTHGGLEDTRRLPRRPWKTLEDPRRLPRRPQEAPAKTPGGSREDPRNFPEDLNGGGGVDGGGYTARLAGLGGCRLPKEAIGNEYFRRHGRTADAVELAHMAKEVVEDLMVERTKALTKIRVAKSKLKTKQVVGHPPTFRCTH
jgi:hypothetical protein